MRTRLANFAAVLSLLVAVATVVLWVHSYSACAWIRWASVGGDATTVRSASSRRGIVVLGYKRLDTRETDFGQLKPPPAGLAGGFGDVGDYVPYKSDRFEGFGLEIGRSSSLGSEELHVTAPHWALAAIATLLPTVRVARSAQGVRRRTAGRCVRCGYDLCATPDCCPECGAVPTGANPTAE